MKKFAISFLFLSLFLFVKAQVYFEQRDVLIQKEINGPFALCAADLNNDGYSEILVANYDGNNAGYYKNLTDGTFDKFRMFDYDFAQAYDITAADLDADGDIDVIVSGSDGVRWYENGGDFDFTVSHQVVSGLGQVRSVYAADLDGDGDKDLVIASFTNNMVGWIPNEGNGSFGSLQQITDTMQGAQEVVAFDFDGDGDNDILAGAYYDSLYWFENLGNGVFSAEKMFDSQVNATFSIFLADFDNDSDLDVFIGDQGDNKIAFYENSGNGNFSSQKLISNAYTGVRSVYVADLDGDNYPDVIAAAYFGDRLVWFKNNGDGTFGSGTPIGIEDTENFVVADDFDNDGDNDVFHCSYNRDKVICLNNDGTAFFTSSTMGYNPNGLYNIELADLDNDNLIDVVYGCIYSRDLSWCKNNGDGTFQKHTLIDNSYPFNDVASADFDGDGDNDLFVVSSAFDLALYYQNTGNGNFSAAVELTDTIDYPQYIETGDMNNDGRIDVVVSSFYDDAIWIFYNAGGGNFTGPVAITDSVNGSKFFALADLDGDNLLDVIATSYLDNKVYWIKNIDGTNFSSLKTIDSYLSKPGRPVPVDMDGDGDLDIVGAEAQGNTLNWYENNGTGVFTEHLISTNYYYGSNGSIAAADIDNDGDIDILIGSTYSDELAWYENLGDQTWDNPKFISDNIDEPVDMKLFDMNSDGYLDMFSASYEDGKIVWFENLPLKILKNPADTMVCAFDNATFSVSAKNVSGFQWKVSYNGISFSDITDNDTYSGANDSVLHINNIQPGMSGYKYFCVLTNPGGSRNTDTVTLFVDTIYPQLQVRNIDLYLDQDGNAILNPQDVIVSASDNCGLADTSISKTNFSCDDLGNNSVVVYLTDTKGNTVFKSANVNVLDSIKPRILTDTIVLFLDASGTATLPSDSIEATDNCVVSEINFSQNSFDCSDYGFNQITVNATDASGNTAQKTIWVFVNDTVTPQLEVKNATLYLDSTGNALLNPDSVIVVLTDNCPLDTSFSQTVFDCGNIGENTVSVTAADAGGNAVQENISVFVYDTILPSLTADTMFLFLDENGLANIEASQLPVFENCSLDYVNVSQDEFDCGDLGANNVSLVVFDGNTDTVETDLTVLVSDTLKPYVSCLSDTVFLTIPEGEDYYTVTNGELNPVDSGDNCEISSVYNSYNNSATMDGEQLQAGVYTVIWYVSDNSGNTDSCTVVAKVSNYTQVASGGEILLYPNPSSGIVKLVVPVEGNIKAVLYGSEGKILMQKISTGENLQFDLTSLPAGVYVLKVYSPEKIKSFRLIKN